MRHHRFAVWTLALGIVAVCASALLSEDALAKEKAKPKARPKAKKQEAAEPATPGQRLPWALRDHFTFTFDQCKLLYAVEDSEWSLNVEGLGDVVDNAGFLITFADGSTLDGHALGKGEATRVNFDLPIGAGTSYTSEYPGKDGIVVRYTMMVFKDRPFVLTKIGIGNTTTKPIEVSKITLVVFGPGGVSRLSPDTESAAQHVQYLGGSPVFDKSGPVSMVYLNDRAHQLCLSFGVVSQGIAKSSVDLQRGGGGWLGDTSCVYAPSVTVQPGEKFESDLAWMTLNVPAPARIDQFHAWAMASMPLPFKGAVDFGASRALPRCWATVEKGGSEADLLGAAEGWKAAGVTHALVPATWEGRPGSLDGCTPAYPKDIAKTAKKIETAGMVPGLSVDPLMTNGGSKDWTASSSDGTSWLNLSNPDAAAHAVQRMKKLVDAGFGFFVITPSSIPDEVLKHFNMTRVQAANLAFGVMCQAAGKRPVFPAALCGVKPDVDSWLEAAAGLGHMADIGIITGPVRAEGLGASSDENLQRAVAMFGGPIEVAGAPKSGEAQSAGQLLLQRRLYAYPVDIANSSPKIWRVPVLGPEGRRGDSVLMFPGAGAWKLADLALDGQEENLVWRASDGGIVDASAPVPAATSFTVYGVTPKLAHPVLMGASSGLALMLNDLKSLSWNESGSTLSGVFEGSSREKATAYVYVPDGWTLKSGKAGSAAVKKDKPGRLEFSVEAGSATNFQLGFQK